MIESGRLESFPVSAADRALVVGAGMVGIACAHYLSRAGYAVTVIDRGKVAGACSHGNCGYVCPSHVLPLTEPKALKLALKSLFNSKAPFRVKPRVDVGLWYWLIQFARRCTQAQMIVAGKPLQAILDASMAEYRRVVCELELDAQWQDSGLLYVLRSEKAVESFVARDRFMTEHFGVPATLMTGSELQAFEPALRPGLAAGFHYPQDAMVRPDRLGASWSAALKAQGVQFIEDCTFERIAESGGRLQSVVTSKGDLQADQVVFATGAWSAKLARSLNCRIPVQPGKGYSVTVARPENCPRVPILFPEHKVGVTPFADGYRLGSMMEFAGFDQSIPPQRIEQLHESAAQYLTTRSDGEVEEEWYGWRPMTWDSLPIIGRVPGREHCYLATGHNMIGLSLAAATGRLIAELIQGEPTYIDATAYSPSRF